MQRDELGSNSGDLGLKSNLVFQLPNLGQNLPQSHCTMRRSQLQSVNRTMYENAYLAPSPSNAYFTMKGFTEKDAILVIFLANIVISK